MRYIVKNRIRDTYIQDPFSDHIIKAFKNHQKEVKVMMGTVITIVDYDVSDTDEITIYVEVE